MSWETVVGLEVHCQLGTRTKLFCRCAVAFGGEPNSRVCPVCTGQPGALPVLNAEAARLAARAALALDGDVQERSVFARKSYFYCDLPKGYQISQYDRPYCVGGGVDLPSGKRVRLERVHMEDDAGKAIHDRGDRTRVDLNRAGVPLIEIVSRPDISNGDEAHAYLTALRDALRYAGVSECDMEKGSLRCDVNVSVRHPGEELRTKVEVKNLNSMRNVAASVEHETARQIALYEAGESPVQETRLFDPDKGETRTMRAKENAADYRYLPDPDLPTLVLPPALLDAERADLPERPAAKRARYVEVLGLSEYDAGVLTAEPDVARWFEAVLALGAAPKPAANWTSNEVLRALSDPEVPGEAIDELRVTPAGLAEVLALLDEGTVSRNAAQTVVRAMLETGRAPRELVAELGLEQIDDDDLLESWCKHALEGREDVAEEVRGGNQKALGALMGPVMKASGGKANPGKVRETLLRLIRGG